MKNSKEELLKLTENKEMIEKIVLKDGKEIYLDDLPHIIILNFGKLIKNKNDIFWIKMILRNDKDLHMFNNVCLDIADALKDEYECKRNIEDNFKDNCRNENIITINEEIIKDDTN